MVEVGSIQIGGSINTAEIERGMGRVQRGFDDVDSKAKSVQGDFDRIAARGKRLTTIFGAMALTGVTAIAGFASGAPAVAGSMAKIKVAAMELKFAMGESLAPAFETASGWLAKLADWVDAHPDLFRGIVTSLVGIFAAATVIKVGGWVYSAFATFFGLLSGVATWAGWATIGGWFTALGTWAKNAATVVGTALGSIWTWLGKIVSKIGGFLTGGAAGSILRAIFGVGGTTAAIGLGPLINTYQREITGEPGFLDKQLQEYNNYQQQVLLDKISRGEAELQQMYFV
jgi:hypothetical protein